MTEDWIFCFPLVEHAPKAQDQTVFVIASDRMYILQDSASSRQSILCPSRISCSKGMLLRYFQSSATPLYFYALYHHFAFLMQVQLSSVVKGQHAPRANLCLLPFDTSLSPFYNERHAADYLPTIYGNADSI